jgi:glutathione peroxidase
MMLDNFVTRLAWIRRGARPNSSMPSFNPDLDTPQEPLMLSRLLSLAAPVCGALCLAPVMVVADEPTSSTSVLDFKAQTIDGQEVPLAQFKGKVLLIVNTASQCGYTPQYSGLQSIYQKYKDQGFEVLAFPANEFGRQEPGSNADIKAFCSQKYQTTFPLFGKIVVAGKDMHPLYRFLTSKETNEKFAGDIPWNFTKFLVDRKGQVVARFAPKDAPESASVTQAIEKALTAAP